MGKTEFLARLQTGLSGLPRKELDERLAFYSEMIDDRMEEGLSEEEAVAAVGPVPEIISQIMSETPLSKIAAERIKPQRQLIVWEIVLLILGAPIWLSLCVSAVVVILSLYIVLWSIVISLWAVFASLVGCSFGGFIAAIVSIATGHVLTGVALIGAAILLAGLSIFLFFGCKAASTGCVMLLKKLILWLKCCILRKGNVS